jgi:stalled ribosome rescue protein Dom34
VAIVSEHEHAIVWVDHREAKIFHVTATEADKDLVQAKSSRHHLEHRANITGSAHRGVDKDYFQRIIAALTHDGSILIAGPGNAKAELNNYIIEQRPDLVKRIAAVETLDHPKDTELLALARKFFRLAPPE